MKRDKKIADSNWGIKPDDQPANAASAPPDAAKVYRYDAAEPDVVRNANVMVVLRDIHEMVSTIVSAIETETLNLLMG